MSGETVLYISNVAIQKVCYRSNDKFGFVRSQVNGSTNVLQNPLYNVNKVFIFSF